MRGPTRRQVLHGLLLALAFLLASALPALAAHQSPPRIQARAAVLIDARSGRVLYAQNADEPLPMASTTKIMTGLLLVENLDPGATLWVPFEVRGVPGSKLYLEPGERYTARDMLLALLVESANDAAITVALNLADSIEDFAAMMNRRAAELGLEHTHFVNPHGLDAEGHHASALDLARLARVAMEHPEFRRAAAAVEATIAHPIRGGTRTLRSHNLFLVTYPDATGVKTGFTNGAMFCLVASAERGDAALIGVILGGDTDRLVASQMRELMDWGFEAFAPRELVSTSQRFTLPEAGGQGQLWRPVEPLVVLLPREEVPDPDDVSWRVAGQRLEVTYRGEPVGSVPLVPAADGNEASGTTEGGAGATAVLGRSGVTAGQSLGVLGLVGVAAAVTAWLRRRRSRRLRYRWQGRRDGWLGGRRL